MPSVTINGAEYPVYADVDFADAFLAADMLRADAWDALTADPQKGRALVTATRQIMRQCWAAGTAPDPAVDPVDPLIAQATSLLAADIAADPSLGDSAATGSNLKRAKAGPAEVEFFYSSESTPLPAAAWQLLLSTGLLCGSAGGGDDGVGSAVYSGANYPSRFHDGCRDEPEIEGYWRG